MGSGSFVAGGSSFGGADGGSCVAVDSFGVYSLGAGQSFSVEDKSFSLEDRSFCVVGRSVPSDCFSERAGRRSWVVFPSAGPGDSEEGEEGVQGKLVWDSRTGAGVWGISAGCLFVPGRPAEKAALVSAGWD